MHKAQFSISQISVTFVLIYHKLVNKILNRVNISGSFSYKPKCTFTLIY